VERGASDEATQRPAQLAQGEVARYGDGTAGVGKPRAGETVVWGSETGMQECSNAGKLGDCIQLFSKLMGSGLGCSDGAAQAEQRRDDVAADVVVDRTGCPWPSEKVRHLLRLYKLALGVDRTQ
jgi:hypothetical protein